MRRAAVAFRRRELGDNSRTDANTYATLAHVRGARGPVIVRYLEGDFSRPSGLPVHRGEIMRRSQ